MKIKFLAKWRMFDSECDRFFRRAMNYLRSNRIEGDYLEFGTYRGQTFISAYYFAQRFGLEHMRFYGFDSFEGMPEIDEDCRLKKGECHMNMEDFMKKLKKWDVDLDKVKLIKGWYDKVLNSKTKQKLNIKKASLIYIDCDLYKSTIPVLNFITDYLQEGTILAFDDWNFFKGNSNKGERRAFREWLDRNKNITAEEFLKIGWGGNSFILNLV